MTDCEYEHLSQQQGEQEQRRWIIVSEEDAAEFASVLEQKAVAVDCEGVNLGRFGSLTLLTVTTPHSTYVIDLINIAEVPRVILDILRELLESEEVLKVLHGCEQDSDAINSHLNIRLQNVYDTQAADLIIRRSYDGTIDAPRNLNDTLQGYGCAVNQHRIVKIDYRSQPDYWSIRPLTDDMLKYATEDTTHLLELRDRQLQYLIARNVSIDEVLAESRKYLTALREASHVEIVECPPTYRGRVIGRGGQGIRALEKAFGCNVWNADHLGGFAVYAHSQSAFESVRSAIVRVTSEVYASPNGYTTYNEQKNMTICEENSSALLGVPL